MGFWRRHPRWRRKKTGGWRSQTRSSLNRVGHNPHQRPAGLGPANGILEMPPKVASEEDRRMAQPDAFESQSSGSKPAPAPSWTRASEWDSGDATQGGVGRRPADGAARRVRVSIEWVKTPHQHPAGLGPAKNISGPVGHDDGGSSPARMGAIPHQRRAPSMRSNPGQPHHFPIPTASRPGVRKCERAWCGLA
jgi:hypothetical protein